MCSAHEGFLPDAAASQFGVKHLSTDM